MTAKGLLLDAFRVWLVIGVLVLVFGILVWAFGGEGTLANVVRGAILWPAHLVR